MAIITPGRMKNRPGYFRRSLRKYIRKGQIVAAAWPPLRGPHRLTWQIASVERIKTAVKLIKVTSARETTTIREALARFLSKHRGLKGSSAIRERDWLTANITGRSWTLTLPDGRKVHSAAVVRDMSDFLDLMEPRVGSLFTRSQAGWRTTVQCRPGAIFTMGVPGSVPQCCPEASIPPVEQAVGGYPPAATTMGLFEQPEIPQQPDIHWRVYFLEVQGGDNASIAELTLHDAIGGPDLAVGGIGSASSRFNSERDAAFAFDKTLTTKWASLGGDLVGAWLAYQLPEPADIIELTIGAPEPPVSGVIDNLPKSFKLQSSADGQNWDDVAQWDGIPAWSVGEVRTFTVE